MRISWQTLLCVVPVLVRDSVTSEIRLLLLLILLLGLTAIIVAVDLVPIQSHLESSTVSATNIADDGHKPIHLTLNNAIGVTTTGPAVRRLDDRPALPPNACWTPLGLNDERPERECSELWAWQ